MSMVLKIGSRYSIAVRDAAEASRAYQAARNASGEGASTFPTGRVYEIRGGRHCRPAPKYRVSYNGRVWATDNKTLVSEAAS